MFICHYCFITILLAILLYLSYLRSQCIDSICTVYAGAYCTLGEILVGSVNEVVTEISVTCCYLLQGIVVLLHDTDNLFWSLTLELETVLALEDVLNIYVHTVVAFCIPSPSVFVCCCAAV